MNDKEKVIKELERVVNAIVDGYIYEPDRAVNAIADAIALLKEQEAVVKPKSKVRHGANAQIQHFCGNCNAMLHGKPKYCSECGERVLWE